MTMKYIKIICISLFILSMKSFAQDFIFFDDSPIASYYDPSWGFSSEWHKPTASACPERAIWTSLA